MSGVECRFCGATLSRVVIDLGLSPLSNALIEPAQEDQSEPLFPLRVFVCETCWLVQIPAALNPEQIFRDYAYFSSYSDSWLAHARQFAQDVASKMQLGADNLVVELASNDGYLLKEFRALSIPVLGIEPARNVARAAEQAGVPTVEEFFGLELARRLVDDGKSADLIVANNVLAHVPDVNDFVAGVALLLKPDGIASIEFPHLLRMLERVEFDTVYHEHFSYFSLRTAKRILERHGLHVIDVQELATHGGSLRVFAKRTSALSSESVGRVLAEEGEANLERVDAYLTFQGAAIRAKDSLVSFLQEARHAGKRVAGYGAPAKATTLLNYCNIGRDLLEYTVDRSPHKQGRLIPGVRVPISAPHRIFDAKPDFVLILPWNLKDEICNQMAAVREWGARFVLPLPSATIL